MINSLLSLITLKVLAKVLDSSISRLLLFDLAKIIACEVHIAFSPFLLVLEDISYFKGLIIRLLSCGVLRMQFKRSFIPIIRFFSKITE